PALLVGAQAPPQAGPKPEAGDVLVDPRWSANCASCQGRAHGRFAACAVPRRAGCTARARSALRELIGGIWLSGAGGARAASYAAGPHTRAPEGTLREAKGTAVKPNRPWAHP